MAHFLQEYRMLVFLFSANAHDTVFVFCWEASVVNVSFLIDLVGTLMDLIYHWLSNFLRAIGITDREPETPGIFMASYYHVTCG
jgi:hypothetical protein